jgi:hypothetical protein
MADYFNHLKTTLIYSKNTHIDDKPLCEVDVSADNLRPQLAVYC